MPTQDADPHGTTPHDLIKMTENAYCIPTSDKS